MTERYDVIGDIHGCYDELCLLLEKLGYKVAEGTDPKKSPYTHPDGRVAVSVGDMGDRGPDSPGVFSVLRQMHKVGTALVVKGNHDDKLERYLKGNKVTVNNGLQTTLNQLENKVIKHKALYKFLTVLPYRLLLDDGKLLVCHAGLKEKYHEGSMNRKIKAKAIYGETTGAKDEKGFPVRLPWQNDYSGERVVVHGHVAQEAVSITNKVYNVDTSCVYGGSLTALRYPEMVLVSQPALKQYCEHK